MTLGSNKAQAADLDSQKTPQPKQAVVKPKPRYRVQPTHKKLILRKRVTRPVVAPKAQQVAKAVQPAQYANAQEVSDWNGFTSALRNKKVDAIVLNQDIQATGSREFALNSSANNYQDWDISRKLTITSKDANKTSTINFGNHFVSFWDINHRWSQENSHPWDITLKDVNITNTDKDFSPFFFNNESVKEANKDKITFDNVTQHGDMLLRSEQVNVELKNNVNINSNLHNPAYSAIYAHSVKIAPNAHVAMNVSNTTNSDFLWGNAAIRIVGENNGTGVEVGQNASLKINPNRSVKNVKGILINGNSDVILDKNANVDMNLGQGNSSAVLGARNLILNDGSNLNIKTMQDNNGAIAWGSANGGHHVSPISLGLNQDLRANNTLEIKRNAQLKIVRTKTPRAVIAGLISFGSYSSNPYSYQNLLVDDGATLDLQDGAQTSWHEYGDKLAEYLGNSNNLYTTGLISMYGIAAKDNVRFGNAKYVNLQRTGSQHGILLRLEGGNAQGTNSAKIEAKGMPLKQWVAGNHSQKADFAWNINYLDTQNKFGDFSYNYNAKGQRPWEISTNLRRRGMTFAQSNSVVRFMDGKSLIYDHSDFNKNFNWWAPQRLSFGTIYAAPVASILENNALLTHVNATTKQSPSLNANKIVLTWKDRSNNNVEAPKYSISWIKDPDTSVATKDNAVNYTGKVEVVVNGEKQLLSVPVRVLGASVKNDGAKVDQNDKSTLPKASYMTDTAAVDRFGIKDVTWAKEPDITTPAAKVYGQTKVNYSDNTSQVLTPYVDVRKVEDGRNRQADKKLYRTITYKAKVINADGTVDLKEVKKHYYRIRYTDYLYPDRDKRRVTYTPWKFFM